MTLLKNIAILAIASFALSSCQNDNSVKEKIQNDDVIEFKQDDNAMNNAIEEAKKTFSQFEELFKKPKDGQESFAIKVRFDTPDGGGEHIWIGDLKTDGKVYTGVVNNEAQSTPDVKLGDTIQIDMNRMSDWMYLDKGVLKGGYTIRVMKNNLSDEEKKNFDKEVGFIIED